MTIKVLGTGCTKCKRLFSHAQAAIGQLGMDANIEKVEDINDIVAFGVLTTPGLAINDEVVVSGRVPDVSEIVSLIADAQ